MLACNMPAAGPRVEPTPIPISTQAVATMVQDIQSAATALQNNQPVRLTFTETQLTTLVAEELKAIDSPTVQNPQVLLRDGMVTLQGMVNQAGVNVSFSLGVTLQVNQQGQPGFQITSATLGPIPMPDSIRNQFNAQLNEAFITQLGPEIDNIFVDEISVKDGLLTISGHPRG